MNGFENSGCCTPSWRDVLEIALVSFVLYRVLLLFHRTRAVRILLGLVVLVVPYAHRVCAQARDDHAPSRDCCSSTAPSRC